MRVKVLLFARLREIVGAGAVELDLPPQATAADAYAALAGAATGLTEMRPRVRCAVGPEYAAWDAVLSDGVELAFIPPTAGG
ncbi:MAG: MoaD/ThiS family protein [Candidatus Dormibacteria bacterium]